MCACNSKSERNDETFHLNDNRLEFDCLSARRHADDNVSLNFVVNVHRTYVRRSVEQRARFQTIDRKTNSTESKYNCFKCCSSSDIFRSIILFFFFLPQTTKVQRKLWFFMQLLQHLNRVRFCWVEVKTKVEKKSTFDAKMYLNVF